MDSIERLVEKIRNNEAKKDELFERLRGFLFQQIGLCGAKAMGYDEGELLSLAWFGVERAISTYSPQKNCRFITWAAICIKYEILSGIKKTNPALVSLDECIDESGELCRHETVEDESAQDDFSHLESKLDGDAAMAALEKLSPIKQAVVRLCCIEDASLKGAAIALGISVGRARSIRLSALRDLQNILCKEKSRPFGAAKTSD